MDLVKLLSKYDPVFWEHFLHTNENGWRTLSDEIQDELIELMEVRWGRQNQTCYLFRLIFVLRCRRWSCGADEHRFEALWYRGGGGSSCRICCCSLSNSWCPDIHHFDRITKSNVDINYCRCSRLYSIDGSAVHTVGVNSSVEKKISATNPRRVY
jgi:hypothetical protein